MRMRSRTRAGSGASSKRGAVGVCRARRPRRRGLAYSSASTPTESRSPGTWQGIVPVVNSTDDGYAGRRRSDALRRTARALRHDRQRLGVDERLVQAGHPREAAINLRPTFRAARPAGPGGEPRDQGRLVSVCAQLLRALPAAGTPCTGNGSRRRAYRVQDGAQQAEFRNATVMSKARIAKERAMIAPRLATIVLGFAAAGLIGISTAAAGEGSADIGRPPPYGFYPIERGRPPQDAYSRPVRYEPAGQRYVTIAQADDSGISWRAARIDRQQALAMMVTLRRARVRPTSGPTALWVFRRQRGPPRHYGRYAWYEAVLI